MVKDPLPTDECVLTIDNDGNVPGVWVNNTFVKGVHIGGVFKMCPDTTIHIDGWAAIIEAGAAVEQNGGKVTVDISATISTGGAYRVNGGELDLESGTIVAHGGVWVYSSLVGGSGDMLVDGDLLIFGILELTTNTGMVVTGSYIQEELSTLSVPIPYPNGSSVVVYGSVTIEGLTTLNLNPGYFDEYWLNPISIFDAYSGGSGDFGTINGLPNPPVGTHWEIGWVNYPPDPIRDWYQIRAVYD
jgi:hypothetical protein